jgi:hypothetical protein
VRIVRQLLIESVLLAAIGGLVGLLVGVGIVRAAPSLLPANLLPSIVVLNFDTRVALFCAVTTFAIGILCGVAPAWQATGVSLVQALTSEGRATTRGGGRFRSTLVVGEIAAAVLLLCGAGLLLRTLVAIGSVDGGVPRRQRPGRAAERRLRPAHVDVRKRRGPASIPRRRGTGGTSDAHDRQRGVDDVTAHERF